MQPNSQDVSVKQNQILRLGNVPMFIDSSVHQRQETRGCRAFLSGSVLFVESDTRRKFTALGWHEAFGARLMGCEQVCDCRVAGTSVMMTSASKSAFCV